MQNIDEEFKKLGYSKYENKKVIEYRLNEDEGMTYILFEKNYKVVRSYQFYNESGEITMQELKLIYEKCSQLGWLK